MKKTTLWLTTIILAVLLLFDSACACEHYETIYFIEDLVLEGKKNPQVGIPGYTGDLCCPDCGEVCIPGTVIPALQPEAELPASDDRDTGNRPRPQPEPQVQPESPVQPETPVQPEQPSGSSGQAQSENPGIQQPSAISGPSETQNTSSGSLPQAAPDRSAPAQTLPSGTTSSSSGRTGKQQTPSSDGFQQQPAVNHPLPPEGKFSWKFPYRRKKLNPQPGIRAEAAGILVWPVPASPFQTLWGN